MKNYVGIDLGTTNSVICSYDGEQTRIWKSPEQNDVTPSAIYIGRRGNKFVGKRAYDSAARSPDNTATLFKRLMGTSTPIKLPAVDVTMSPEECSGEVLRALFGYLPEEMRNDLETGTVITVPAAFNQMQKNATIDAAEMAGIGQVALIQEPVAAVMSVMKVRDTDGISVIYDLGGGTLDVAIAESLGGRINLLAHGGIAMCGGRDFDRLLVDNVVKPWLLDEFDLPEGISADPKYRKLVRVAAWGAERAKVELSSQGETAIRMEEMDIGVRDQSGEDIYFDIPVERSTLDKLMTEKVGESIEAARETLDKAGLSQQDIQRVVFIGGPTNYKPLRDRVAFELGLDSSTDVNPMTAVAEGAAIFAESIDWGRKSRNRKTSRGTVSASGPLNVRFNYTARTPSERAKIVAQVDGEVEPGAEFQVDNLDTGWSSGRRALAHGTSVDVSLSKSGENRFKVLVFDLHGGALTLERDTIAITKTAAIVEAIPASHSIGIEVRETLGGNPTVEWLVRAGDELPKKGSKTFKAGESLRAGSNGSLNFRLIEGESDDPEYDRLIGMLKITGDDLDDGVIYAGAELQCEYEMYDSGGIVLEVSVPSVGATFHSGRNYYSRQEGQIDFSTEGERVKEQERDVFRRLDEISERVTDPKLDQAHKKLEQAALLDPDHSDTEQVQEAMDGVEEARRILAEVRKRHQKDIRKIELDRTTRLFDSLREFGRPSERNDFDNLVRTAQRAIDRNDSNFDRHLNDLTNTNFHILWRQDWFVVEKFKSMVSSRHWFADRGLFEALVASGRAFLEDDDIDSLRGIVGQLTQIQISHVSDTDMMEGANIIRG